MNDMEKDISENKDNMEKLQVDFKQLEVDAAKVMDEHEKLQVSEKYRCCCIQLLLEGRIWSHRVTVM